MNSTDGGQARESPAIELRLLDGFELRLDDTPLHPLPSAQRLLAFLALREHAISRAAVATTLWPHVSARRAAACLRSTLWRLLKPPRGLVEVDADTLRIAPGVYVDVVSARRFAARVARSAEVGGDTVPITHLYADLLPGWPDPWIVTEREWFRQLRLRTLETLSERFRTSGDRFRAYETAMAAVQGDPLRESAHRQLIELHLVEGNPAEALRQYTRYRTTLRSELGLAPSPEIHKLVHPAATPKPRQGF